jgi:SAM-dependent methyltransferase
MSYWKIAIRRKDSKSWHADYDVRLDPEAPLQDVIAKHIDRTVGVNRILDVGSGPLTSINKKCGFCQISITAVDPLADFYNEILAKREITPPVRTELGWGERLTEQFGENQFEITYSRNAIDHSYDPIKCIDEMIKVTKKNHYVIAEINERGGSLEGWTGLHQWDFFVARALPFLKRHLFVEGKSVEAVDVTRHFAKVAEMTTLEITDGPERSITFVLRKRAD